MSEMPSAARKACAYGGCPNLVERGYCEVHRGLAAAGQPDLHREWSRLYNSARWRKIRARQLRREPWCAECLRSGVHTQATDVDHIVPHRGDVERFYHGALQSLCHQCHASKTAREVRSMLEGRGHEKVF